MIQENEFMSGYSNEPEDMGKKIDALVFETTPAIGTDGVAVDAAIRIKFTSAPDLKTCNSQTITFTPAVDWVLKKCKDKKEIVVSPTAPLAAKQIYDVLIEGVKTSTGGEVFPYLLRFATR